MFLLYIEFNIQFYVSELIKRFKKNSLKWQFGMKMLSVDPKLRICNYCPHIW